MRPITVKISNSLFKTKIDFPMMMKEISCVCQAVMEINVFQHVCMSTTCVTGAHEENKRMFFLNYVFWPSKHVSLQLDAFLCDLV